MLNATNDLQYFNQKYSNVPIIEIIGVFFFDFQAS